MPRKRSVFILVSFSLVLAISILLCHHISPDENERFEKYIDTLFCEELRCNTLSLAYTLKHPETFGIENDTASLGRINCDTAAACAVSENTIAQLSRFNPAKLSGENRLTYNLLEDSFSISKKLAPFTLYEEPLAPLTGTQAQLPILLSEYPINSTDDIETYFALLKDFPNYFTSLTDFEKAKSEQGLFMSASHADAVIEECTSFINMKENHYLHTSFKSRLSELGLSEEETENYIRRNKDCLETYVFPAYQELSDQLKKLRETGKDNLRFRGSCLASLLCDWTGKAYPAYMEVL